jgi:hypothetical protein
MGLRGQTPLPQMLTENLNWVNSILFKDSTRTYLLFSRRELIMQMYLTVDNDMTATRNECTKDYTIETNQ